MSTIRENNSGRTCGENENDRVFQALVRETAFPCVGAKSALAHDQITIYIADNIDTATSDEDITDELQQFAEACTPESLFVSFVIIFENTPELTEAEFETALWNRLQAIHNNDSFSYSWDRSVSADPQSPHFSMSIGGKAFYVIGLHPNASRPARRFPKAILVFNLHSQFELLRDEGSYTRIRNTILARDAKLSGSNNPMLAVHGESSEARQYSGRELDAAWKCPFHAKEMGK